jgi:hypothetical protein
MPAFEAAKVQIIWKQQYVLRFFPRVSVLKF